MSHWPQKKKKKCCHTSESDPFVCALLRKTMKTLQACIKAEQGKPGSQPPRLLSVSASSKRLHWHTSPTASHRGEFTSHLCLILNAKFKFFLFHKPHETYLEHVNWCCITEQAGIRKKGGLWDWAQFNTTPFWTTTINTRRWIHSECQNVQNQKNHHHTCLQL